LFVFPLFIRIVEDVWQKIADELNIQRVHIQYYDRLKNPAKELLTEVCGTRELTVGELYDILVTCDANALADEYL
jgi:hypothetical protein